MPEIEVDVETTVHVDVQVWCECGKGLCSQTTVKDNELYVEPCSKCLATAEMEGYDKGYDKGYIVGESRAYNNE